MESNDQRIRWAVYMSGVEHLLTSGSWIVSRNMTNMYADTAVRNKEFYFNTGDFSVSQNDKILFVVETKNNVVINGFAGYLASYYHGDNCNARAAFVNSSIFMKNSKFIEINTEIDTSDFINQMIGYQHKSDYLISWDIDPESEDTNSFKEILINASIL